MLMQNFKSAADLGITEPQLSALQKTLVLLETGKLAHIPGRFLKATMNEPVKYDGFFNMCFSYATADCGTVACIKGSAELVGDVKFDVCDIPDGLSSLFYSWAPCKTYDPSAAQAATALRSYLTTGNARWDLAVA